MDVYGLGGVYGFGNAKKTHPLLFIVSTWLCVHQILADISCVNALSVRCIPHLGTCHTLHPVQKVTCKQDSADLVTRTLGSTVIVSCTESHKRST